MTSYVCLKQYIHVEYPNTCLTKVMHRAPGHLCKVVILCVARRFELESGRDSPVMSLQLVSPEGLLVKEMRDVHIQCDKPFTKSFEFIGHLVSKVQVLYSVLEIHLELYG